MPRQRRALLLAALLSCSFLAGVGAGELDPPAGAPPQEQQQQPLPAPVQAPAQEQAQAPPPADAAPVAPPATPAADGVTVPAAPAVVAPPVPPADDPLTPRQPVELNDPIVLKAAGYAMVDVDPVAGKAIGWRVVRADKQSVAAGTYHYLQIELRTKARCEVHEKRVLVEAKTGNFIVGGLGELLPCNPSLPPADYMTKSKGLRSEVGGEKLEIVGEQ